MSALGPKMLVSDATGLIETRSVGQHSLDAGAAHGARVAVVTSLTGKHQIDLVPNSITPAYVTWETGKWSGVTLAASDVDPGGVVKLQNLTGKALYLRNLMVHVTTPATGGCTVDVGLGADPVPVGGSASIFDGIDVNNAGVNIDFDSLFDGDHPGSGRPGGLWPAGEWLSITMKTGATAGLVGRCFFLALDHNAVGWA